MTVSVPRRLLPSLGLLAAALAACGSPPAGPRTAGAVDSVLFLRYGCYSGECPAYRVLFRSDGSAEWLGTELSQPPGPATGHVAAADWRALAASVVAVGLDTLEDVYPASGLESSRSEIRVFTAGWPARVVASAGDAGPPPLEALFTRVDSLAATLGWRGLPRYRPTTGGLRPY